MLLTEPDLYNLSLLGSAALRRLLASATVVPWASIPVDTVTMYSRICCRTRDGVRHVLTLVYPGEENPASGRVAVTAPAGMALLGAHAGQEIEAPLQAGEPPRVLRLEAVLYQPERDLRSNLVTPEDSP